MGKTPLPPRNIFAPKAKPEHRLVTAAKEAAAIAKGEAEPARVYRVGRPRIGEDRPTLVEDKPWEALKMSRRTWQRRQKEKRDER